MYRMNTNNKMEFCNYKQISENDRERITNKGNRTLFWKPFLRQMLVCFGLWMVYFAAGLIIGAPTVVIPQLRKEANDTTVVNDEMASWLTSLVGGAALLWVLPVPILMYYIGRKMTFAFVCTIMTIGYIVFYCSVSVLQILFSELILGITLGSAFTLWPAILTEYSSPRYRGVILTIKSATMYWGIWVANGIGSYFYWKNIGLIAIICCLLATTVFLWPESPYWLATKGRFEECARAHRLLRGTGKESELELESMINSQRLVLDDVQKSSPLFSKERCRKIYESLISREFYMPFTICVLLFLLYYSSAKLICSLYAIDIFKKMTGSEAMGYKTMLILDGVTVFSMYIGCGVCKVVKRRTMLFTTSGMGALLLFTMSIYFYLVHLEILNENNYVTITMLVVYTLSLSVGPIILCSSLHGEIIPMKYKSSMSMLTSTMSSVIFLFYMKFAPSLFRSIGLHGAFLLYGVCTSICIFLLYKCLPETKDKTLLEIEEYFKSNSQQLSEGRELMSMKTYDNTPNISDNKCG